MSCRVLGFYHISNGDIYDGEWIEGQRNGKGKFKSINEEYLGYWKNNKKKWDGHVN